MACKKPFVTNMFVGVQVICKKTKRKRLEELHTSEVLGLFQVVTKIESLAMTQ
jgi:hypothetical protein